LIPKCAEDLCFGLATCLAIVRPLPEGGTCRAVGEFGDVIVSQGEAADTFYVLISGRARVIKKTEQGQELPLNLLRPR
jgi:CRP-like cAMP-binding protein